MPIRDKIQQLKYKGQNIARTRIGRTPAEATQRMRDLRARSPIVGQLGHPLQFPRPKYGQFGQTIPKPFGGKIYYKVTYWIGRLKGKLLPPYG